MSGKWMVLIVALCCIGGVRCSSRNKVPADVLSREKMEAVMWDMAQADQYAGIYLTKDSPRIDRKTETMRLYAEVFRLHQITPEEFRRSYRYYLDHPDLNQQLFDSVIARGSRARTELYDRPGQQYHPPVIPVRTVGKPVPGMPGGAAHSPGSTLPGARTAVPGTPMSRTAGPDMMRRMHAESVRRRQDSLMRLQIKRDTTGKRN